jgi:hypothetical protein
LVGFKIVFKFIRHLNLPICIQMQFSMLEKATKQNAPVIRVNDAFNHSP